MSTEGVLKELTLARDDDTTLSHWSSGMSELNQCRVLNVLRELGKVAILTPDTPNYVSAQAAEANRAYGVNQALDILMNFREVLQGVTGKPIVPAEFGGLDQALINQDVTEEEANAIRDNKPIPRLERIPIPDFSASS